MPQNIDNSAGRISRLFQKFHYVTVRLFLVVKTMFYKVVRKTYVHRLATRLIKCTNSSILIYMDATDR